MPKERDYHAEYLARQGRAKSEGWESYSQKKYYQDVSRTEKVSFEKLKNIVVGAKEQPPERGFYRALPREEPRTEAEKKEQALLNKYIGDAAKQKGIDPDAVTRDPEFRRGYQEWKKFTDTPSKERGKFDNGPDSKMADFLRYCGYKTDRIFKVGETPRKKKGK